jgi:hypothetical protein
MGNDFPANENDKRNQKVAKEPFNCKSKPQQSKPDSKMKSHFQEETKMPEMGTQSDKKPGSNVLAARNELGCEYPADN